MRFQSAVRLLITAQTKKQTPANQKRPEKSRKPQEIPLNQRKSKTSNKTEIISKKYEIKISTTENNETHKKFMFFSHISLIFGVHNFLFLVFLKHLFKNPLIFSNFFLFEVLKTHYFYSCFVRNQHAV